MKNIIIPVLLLLALSVQAALKTDSVKNGNVYIYYQVQGKGEPVYVLAGGPGLTPYYMQPVVDELSKTNQCVLIHQRGTGLSKFIPTASVKYIDQFCEDIHLVRQQLGHKQITLLGHSWGGMLAMNMATKYPREIKKLILVSSGGYNLNFLGYFKDNIFSKLSLSDQQIVAAQAQLGADVTSDKKLSELALLKIMTTGYFYQKQIAGKIEMKQGDINQQSSAEVWKSLSESRWDLGGILSELRVPTLVVQGRQDPMDLQTANTIKVKIHESRLEVIEACGHFPWLEQPKVFFEILSPFLAGAK
jgi:proline iminopeptidase